MSVRLPAWWSWPERCEHGHEWGPGLVLVSFERCNCAPVRTAYPDGRGRGHLTVACGTRGCRSTWYTPPHERPPGLTSLLPQAQIVGGELWPGPPSRNPASLCDRHSTATGEQLVTLEARGVENGPGPGAGFIAGDPSAPPDGLRVHAATLTGAALSLRDPGGSGEPGPNDSKRPAGVASGALAMDA
jgi:hypothetical protein